MGIAVNETSPKLFASKLNEIFRKMSSISAIVFVVFWTAFAVAATDKKVDVKMVDLAEELARSRQDLAKSQEETKRILRRENKKLRQEDQKLKRQSQKLKEEDQKLKDKTKSLRKKMKNFNKS